MNRYFFSQLAALLSQLAHTKPHFLVYAAQYIHATSSYIYE